ncbi:MAG TPA: ankyrin repeat domain-containing protein, partial [Verrucomicrobium sp.]|nr:ankyrin repeat domain-containing protein [Verrucomicrobium sp.]
MRFGPTLWLLAVVSTAPLQGQVDSAVAVSEEQKQIELTAIAESALWQGDPALVQRLIAAGWNVNAEGGRSGDKLFYQFIQKGSHKIVAAMVAAGARLNDVDEQGRTPLSVAAGGASDNPSEESSRQMVKYLIEQGADIHAGGEAAVAAASGNNLSLVKFLVAMGGKPTPMALATAVGAWKRDVVDYLLQSGVDPKARLEDGRSLLHMLPDKELFVKLLALGLDLNAADNQGRRPVHVAASWGNLKMGEMKLLLEHGADVNAADVEGTTPLMLSTPCRWNDRPTMLEYLLDKGAKLDQRDKQGRTVMDRAWEDGAWEDVLLLKERGLGIANARGRLESFLKNSLTTPVEASAAGKIVAWLLPQAGSLADFKPYGKPLTVWFVLMGQNDLWTMCLKQGVPVDAADAEGRTALMWAEMTGAKQAKSLLLASGARRDLKDGRGKTAANWAAWHDQLERNRKIGESDGSPLSQSHDSRTALEAKRDAFFAAVVQGRAEDVRRQLSANPELMKQLHGGFPPLHVAAGFGKLTVMDELVRRGAPLNEMAANGEVPVVLAVRGGQEEAVAWLLKKAPGVVYVEMSPLAGAAAVAARQNDVLRQLVRDGWRPATGEPSLKALQVAVESNDATLFQMLVKGGAELRPVVLKTPSGKDPFKDLLRALCTV